VGDARQHDLHLALAVEQAGAHLLHALRERGQLVPAHRGTARRGRPADAFGGVAQREEGPQQPVAADEEEERQAQQAAGEAPPPPSRRPRRRRRRRTRGASAPTAATTLPSLSWPARIPTCRCARPGPEGDRGRRALAGERALDLQAVALEEGWASRWAARRRADEHAALRVEDVEALDAGGGAHASSLERVPL
jgi:hypothetical protein